MNQQPKIVNFNAQEIIGIPIMNSLAQDKTPEVWKQLMPRRHEIVGRSTTQVYDLKIYPKDLEITNFTPHTIFEKWAAIPVNQIATIPDGMQHMTIPAGTYAVFIHKGPAHTFPETLGWIFNTWLPSSGYVLEDRPHFEVLEETYLPTDPNAEEEIWIPING